MTGKVSFYINLVSIYRLTFYSTLDNFLSYDSPTTLIFSQLHVEYQMIALSLRSSSNRNMIFF